VAALLGIPNTHHGIVFGNGRLLTDGSELLAATGDLTAGSEVVWSLRPERIAIAANGHYSAQILDVLDLGSTHELTIELTGGLTLTLRTSDTSPAPVGSTVRVDIAAEHIALWPAGTVPGSARAQAA
jgi:ABC-type Fe3+/spermidine/putrescine transport system ATPase subunit